MPSPEVNTLLGILIVSTISLIGVAAMFSAGLRRHGILLALVAFAAGTLLGDSFFHLLPEAVEHRGGFPIELTLLVLGGFLAFFLLEGALRWGHAHGEEAHPHLPHEAHRDAPKVQEGRVAPFAWTNLVGDGMHNFVDGALIAAAFYAGPIPGIATTVAVAAHEIPQELGDFAVLIRGGLRPRTALFYNFLSAALAFVGGLVVIGFALLSDIDMAETMESFAIPFIAGGFLYIAAADLVPELHHHSEGKLIPVILAGIILGMGLMAGLLFLG